MTHLQLLKDGLICNLSHHLFNKSGLNIIIDKKYNELTFYFDFTMKSDASWRVFTIFTDNDIFELIPTDNHKNLIPEFKTSSFDEILFYITTKFVNL